MITHLAHLVLGIMFVATATTGVRDDRLHWSAELFLRLMYLSLGAGVLYLSGVLR